eukprot:Lithocolla_globosa_v1_NODE_1570_length_2479_cov_19.554043.p3 type:complete len:100 gc:universal NODE_1570_length_2479_cov_19.554043:510-211(-)
MRSQTHKSSLRSPTETVTTFLIKLILHTSMWSVRSNSPGLEGDSNKPLTSTNKVPSSEFIENRYTFPIKHNPAILILTKSFTNTSPISKRTIGVCRSGL